MYIHQRNSEAFTVWLYDNTEFERMLTSYLSLCSIGLAASEGAGQLSLDFLSFTVGIQLNEGEGRETHYLQAIIERAVTGDRTVESVIVSLMHPLETDVALYVLIVRDHPNDRWQINTRIETERIEVNPSSPFGPSASEGHFLYEPVVQQLLSFMG